MKKIHVLYLSVALVVVTAFLTQHYESLQHYPDYTLAEAVFRLLKVEEQCGLKVDKYRCAHSEFLSRASDRDKAPWWIFREAENSAYRLKQEGRYTEANKKLLDDYKVWLINNTDVEKAHEKIQKEIEWIDKRNAYLFWWYPKNKE